MEASANVLDTIQRARTEIGQVIIGQRPAIDLSLITILTGGHALIEGVPGVAKTLLVRTLGAVLGGDTKRIQFTPDLMPTDITGTNVFNLKSREFNLLKGPIFTTFLLADEINRAPAKTQSALLQAMQERQVTIDTDTHSLPPAFTVFATQNPIEYEGTYPLPEAQKDRFILKIIMDYPARDGELELVSRQAGPENPEHMLANGAVRPVINIDDLAGLRAALGTIDIREELMGYVVDIIRQTRQHPAILVGAGPRATQALLATSRVHAVLQERDFVNPDDVKAMAPAVLAHRLVLRPEFEIEGVTVMEVVAEILQEVAVPR